MIEKTIEAIKSFREGEGFTKKEIIEYYKLFFKEELDRRTELGMDGMLNRHFKRLARKGIIFVKEIYKNQYIYDYDKKELLKFEKQLKESNKWLTNILTL